jgi:hypothetical protein
MVMVMKAADWINENNDQCDIEVKVENFTDVPNEDAAYPYINNARERCIVNGYRDKDNNLESIFGMQDNITRAQAAKIIVNAFSLKSIDTNERKMFSDVEESTWYFEPVKIASDNAIITGYLEGDNAGKFKPDDNIVRADAILMIYRAMNRVMNK